MKRFISFLFLFTIIISATADDLPKHFRFEYTANNDDYPGRLIYPTGGMLVIREWKVYEIYYSMLGEVHDYHSPRILKFTFYIDNKKIDSATIDPFVFVYTMPNKPGIHPFKVKAEVMCDGKKYKTEFTMPDIIVMYENNLPPKEKK